MRSAVDRISCILPRSEAFSLRQFHSLNIYHQFSPQIVVVIFNPFALPIVPMKMLVPAPVNSGTRAHNDGIFPPNAACHHRFPSTFRVITMRWISFDHHMAAFRCVRHEDVRWLCREFMSRDARLRSTGRQTAEMDSLTKVPNRPLPGYAVSDFGFVTALQVAPPCGAPSSMYGW